MRVFVHARPRAKRARIEVMDESHLKIEVKEAPVEDRANQAIIRALARHYRVAPAEIRLLSGRSSRQKVFEVPDKEMLPDEPAGRD